MIEKKCENCASRYLCESYEADTGRPLCSNFDLFIAKEELVRKDESEKIIDTLWLSITDDKKIIFEKDGHEFKLNLVPIINSEVE